MTRFGNPYENQPLTNEQAAMNEADVSRLLRDETLTPMVVDGKIEQMSSIDAMTLDFQRNMDAWDYGGLQDSPSTVASNTVGAASQNQELKYSENLESKLDVFDQILTNLNVSDIGKEVVIGRVRSSSNKEWERIAGGGWMPDPAWAGEAGLEVPKSQLVESGAASVLGLATTWLDVADDRRGDNTSLTQSSLEVAESLGYKGHPAYKMAEEGGSPYPLYDLLRSEKPEMETYVESYNAGIALAFNDDDAPQTQAFLQGVAAEAREMGLNPLGDVAMDQFLQTKHREYVYQGATMLVMGDTIEEQREGARRLADASLVYGHDIIEESLVGVVEPGFSVEKSWAMIPDTERAFLEQNGVTPETFSDTGITNSYSLLYHAKAVAVQMVGTQRRQMHIEKELGTGAYAGMMQMAGDLGRGIADDPEAVQDLMMTLPIGIGTAFAKAPGWLAGRSFLGGLARGFTANAGLEAMYAVPTGIFTSMSEQHHLYLRGLRGQSFDATQTASDTAFIVTMSAALGGTIATVPGAAFEGSVMGIRGLTGYAADGVRAGGEAAARGGLFGDDARRAAEYHDLIATMDNDDVRAAGLYGNLSQERAMRLQGEELGALEASQTIIDSAVTGNTSRVEGMLSPSALEGQGMSQIEAANFMYGVARDLGPEGKIDADELADVFSAYSRMRGERAFDATGKPRTRAQLVQDSLNTRAKESADNFVTGERVGSAPSDAKLVKFNETRAKITKGEKVSDAEITDMIDVALSMRDKRQAENFLEFMDNSLTGRMSEDQRVRVREEIEGRIEAGKKALEDDPTLRKAIEIEESVDRIADDLEIQAQRALGMTTRQIRAFTRAYINTAGNAAARSRLMNSTPQGADVINKLYDTGVDNLVISKERASLDFATFRKSDEYSNIRAFNLKMNSVKTRLRNARKRFKNNATAYKQARQEILDKDLAELEKLGADLGVALPDSNHILDRLEQRVVNYQNMTATERAEAMADGLTRLVDRVDPEVAAGTSAAKDKEGLSKLFYGSPTGDFFERAWARVAFWPQKQSKLFRDRMRVVRAGAQFIGNQHIGRRNYSTDEVGTVEGASISARMVMAGPLSYIKSMAMKLGPEKYKKMTSLLLELRMTGAFAKMNDAELTKALEGSELAKKYPGGVKTLLADMREGDARLTEAFRNYFDEARVNGSLTDGDGIDPRTYFPHNLNTSLNAAQKSELIDKMTKLKTDAAMEDNAKINLDVLENLGWIKKTTGRSERSEKTGVTATRYDYEIPESSPFYGVTGKGNIEDVKFVIEEAKRGRAFLRDLQDEHLAPAVEAPKTKGIKTSKSMNRGTSKKTVRSSASKNVDLETLAKVLDGDDSVMNELRLRRQSIISQNRDEMSTTDVLRNLVELNTINRQMTIREAEIRAATNNEMIGMDNVGIRSDLTPKEISRIAKDPTAFRELSSGHARVEFNLQSLITEGAITSKDAIAVRAVLADMNVSRMSSTAMSRTDVWDDMARGFDHSFLPQLGDWLDMRARGEVLKEHDDKYLRRIDELAVRIDHDDPKEQLDYYYEQGRGEGGYVGRNTGRYGIEDELQGHDITIDRDLLNSEKKSVGGGDGGSIIAAQLIVHEMYHTLINTMSPQMKRTLQAIYDHAESEKWLEFFGRFDIDGEYALSNLDEFVAALAEVAIVRNRFPHTSLPLDKTLGGILKSLKIKFVKLLNRVMLKHGGVTQAAQEAEIPAGQWNALNDAVRALTGTDVEQDRVARAVQETLGISEEDLYRVELELAAGDEAILADLLSNAKEPRVEERVLSEEEIAQARFYANQANESADELRQKQIDGNTLTEEEEKQLISFMQRAEEMTARADRSESSASIELAEELTPEQAMENIQWVQLNVEDEAFIDNVFANGGAYIPTSGPNAGKVFTKLSDIKNLGKSRRANDTESSMTKSGSSGDEFTVGDVDTKTPTPAEKAVAEDEIANVEKILERFESVADGDELKHIKAARQLFDLEKKFGSRIPDEARSKSLSDDQKARVEERVKEKMAKQKNAYDAAVERNKIAEAEGKPLEKLPKVSKEVNVRKTESKRMKESISTEYWSKAKLKELDPELYDEMVAYAKANKIPVRAVDSPWAVTNKIESIGDTLVQRLDEQSNIAQRVTQESTDMNISNPAVRSTEDSIANKGNEEGEPTPTITRESDVEPKTIVKALDEETPVEEAIGREITADEKPVVDEITAIVRYDPDMYPVHGYSRMTTEQLDELVEKYSNVKIWLRNQNEWFESTGNDARDADLKARLGEYFVTRKAEIEDEKIIARLADMTPEERAAALPELSDIDLRAKYDIDFYKTRNKPYASELEAEADKLPNSTTYPELDGYSRLNEYQLNEIIDSTDSFLEFMSRITEWDMANRGDGVTFSREMAPVWYRRKSELKAAEDALEAPAPKTTEAGDGTPPKFKSVKDMSEEEIFDEIGALEEYGVEGLLIDEMAARYNAIRNELADRYGKPRPEPVTGSGSGGGGGGKPPKAEAGDGTPPKDPPKTAKGADGEGEKPKKGKTNAAKKGKQIADDALDRVLSRGKYVKPSHNGKMNSEAGIDNLVEAYDEAVMDGSAIRERSAQYVNTNSTNLEESRLTAADGIDIDMMTRVSSGSINNTMHREFSDLDMETDAGKAMAKIFAQNMDLEKTLRSYAQNTGTQIKLQTVLNKLMGVRGYTMADLFDHLEGQARAALETDLKTGKRTGRLTELQEEELVNSMRVLKELYLQTIGRPVRRSRGGADDLVGIGRNLAYSMMGGTFSFSVINVEVLKALGALGTGRGLKGAVQNIAGLVSGVMHVAAGGAARNVPGISKFMSAFGLDSSRMRMVGEDFLFAMQGNNGNALSKFGLSDADGGELSTYSFWQRLGAQWRAMKEAGAENEGSGKFGTFMRKLLPRIRQGSASVADLTAGGSGMMQAIGVVKAMSISAGQNALIVNGNKLIKLAELMTGDMSAKELKTAARKLKIPQKTAVLAAESGLLANNGRALKTARERLGLTYGKRGSRGRDLDLNRLQHVIDTDRKTARFEDAATELPYRRDVDDLGDEGFDDLNSFVNYLNYWALQGSPELKGSQALMTDSPFQTLLHSMTTYSLAAGQQLVSNGVATAGPAAAMAGLIALMMLEMNNRLTQQAVLGRDERTRNEARDKMMKIVSGDIDHEDIVEMLALYGTMSPAFGATGKIVKDIIGVPAAEAIGVSTAGQFQAKPWVGPIIGANTNLYGSGISFGKALAQGNPQRIKTTGQRAVKNAVNAFTPMNTLPVELATQAVTGDRIGATLSKIAMNGLVGRGFQSPENTRTSGVNTYFDPDAGTNRLVPLSESAKAKAMMEEGVLGPNAKRAALKEATTPPKEETAAAASAAQPSAPPASSPKTSVDKFVDFLGQRKDD